MIGIIVYLSLAYWIASYFFFRKSRHYYFQRYLYFFILQGFLILAAVDYRLWIYINLLYLKYVWLFIISVLLLLYALQATLAILKTFPTVATMEWWEAFHLYNMNSLLRSITIKKAVSISNKDWLQNQSQLYLYKFNNFIKFFKICRQFLFLLCFCYLLVNCWSLDTELMIYTIDFFCYNYCIFFPILTFFYYFICSLFLKRLKKKYLLVATSIIFEPGFVDKADFNPNFGFILGIENSYEFQKYFVDVLHLRLPDSHKRLTDEPYYSLQLTTESSRLVWNDTWWDCNNLYYSPLFKFSKQKYVK